MPDPDRLLATERMHELEHVSDGVLERVVLVPLVERSIVRSLACPGQWP